MNRKTISEIEEIYDLELDRVELKIKKEKAKRVLLQFPDGMKQYATVIVVELEKRMENVEFFIWFGTCFGACDTPNIPKNLKVDLTIQFGHSAWNN
ncbi:MAG: diphthamide synthesis protein [Nanoarchaeota archaeon]